MSSSHRSVNVDIIRIFAMWMVILLHTVLNFTIRPDFFATKVYFLFEPFMAIAKTGVLLFFMLSGYLVIAKQRSLSENLAKTVKRILLPLFCFSIINIILEAWPLLGTSWDWKSFSLQQIQRMVHFPSSPLWFLVVLGFLYILNPIWQQLFENDKQKITAQFITYLSLSFGIITTFFQYFAKNTNMFNSFTAWMAFVGFYLYGGLLKKNWLNIPKLFWNGIIIVIGVFCTCLGDILTHWLTLHQISSFWIDYTSNYLSIPVVLTSIGLFNFLLQTNFKKLSLFSLSWLANHSFGIYLLHPYVISFLMFCVGFDFNKMSLNVYLFTIYNIILVFTISLFLTVVLKKIPKIRMLIGG